MELLAVYVHMPERFWKIIEHRATHETNYVVQEWLCVTLARIVGAGKDEEDKTTHVMDKMIKQSLSQTEKVTLPNQLIDLLMRLAISRENPWARKTIENILLKNPIQHADSLNRAVFWVMKEYVVPKNLEMSDRREATKRAIDWLGDVTTVACSEIKKLNFVARDHVTEETNKNLSNLYRLIDEVIMRLYVAVANARRRSEKASRRNTTRVKS